MSDDLKPTLPDWIKIYNQYNETHYPAGKLITAEEWNALFKGVIARATTKSLMCMTQ